MTRRILGQATGASAVAAATGALVVLSPPGLAPAAWADPAAIDRWLLDVGPVTAGMGVLRLVTLALGAYLSIILAAGAAADLAGSVRARTAVDRCTAPALRRLLAGAAVSATALAPSAAALAATAPAPPPPSSGDRMVEVLDDGPPTMHLVGPAPGTEPPTAPPAATAPATTAPAAQAPPDAAAARAPAPTDEQTWVVAPGDSFWSITATELAARLGRAPTDAEVMPRWRALVEANRQILVVPGDEDLLYPGQVVQLVDL